MKSFFICLWSVLFVILLTFIINCFEGYLYPIKYSEEIKKYSEQNLISASLVASVINVESAYKKDCVSSKGAKGLMQIMPETAKWIAEKREMEFVEDKLFDIEYNIDFGCYYLSYLMRYFEDEDLAICAYNAGMGNVSKWLKDESLSENGKLVKIPFEETNTYLNKVKKNIRHYKNKYQI